MAPGTARVLQNKCRFLGPTQTSSPWNPAQECVGTHYAGACGERTNDLSFPGGLRTEGSEHQASSLEIPKEIILSQKCPVIAILGQSQPLVAPLLCRAQHSLTGRIIPHKVYVVGTMTEVAQGVEGLPAKPQDTRSILKTHNGGWRKPTPSSCPLTSMCVMTCPLGT